MNTKERAALRAQANQLDVTLQIGKDGIKATTATELAAQLKAKKLVKVKLLPSAHGTALDELAEKTGSQIVEKKGHTAVFYKR